MGGEKDLAVAVQIAVSPRVRRIKGHAIRHGRSQLQLRAHAGALRLEAGNNAQHLVRHLVAGIRLSGQKFSAAAGNELGVDRLDLYLSVRRHRAAAAVLPKEDAVLRRRQRFVGRLGQQIALGVAQRISKPVVRLNAIGAALAVDQTANILSA